MKINRQSVQFYSISMLNVMLIWLLTACGTSTDFRLPYRNLLLPDMNIVPYNQVKQGGILRLPMEVFPTNFNYNQMGGAGVDLITMMRATSFGAFKQRMDGSFYFDRDYFTDISETTVHGKQTLIYTINPKAHWTDGTPISGRDFAVYVHALSGKDHRYLTTGTTGYDQIESVLPGKDDRQVIVTMKQPLGEWKGMLFDPMYPASVQDTPEKFNTALINHTPPTAGPFTFASINHITKIVTLKRDPHWWGRPAKLDSIQFTEMSSTSGIEPYITHEIDALELKGSINFMQRALEIPHTVVRRALSTQYMHLTFNNAVGRITHDVHIRHAIAKAIDRHFLLYAGYKAIVDKDFPLLNNHFFALGIQGNQDNSGGLDYNPAAARQELEKDGWRLDSDGIRYQDGQSLAIMDIESAAAPLTDHSIYALVQAYLKAIGIRMIIQYVPNNEFFPTYIKAGNFDTSLFRWEMTSTPLSSGVGIYRIDPHCMKTAVNYNPQICDLGENYGLQGSTKINAALEHVLTMTNDQHRIAEANKIDQLLWQNMGQLPLYQQPMVMAMDSRIANYGIDETDSTDWTKVGWTK